MLSRTYGITCIAFFIALLAVATSAEGQTVTVTVTAPASTSTAVDTCDSGEVQCCASVVPVGCLVEICERLAEPSFRLALD